MQIATASEDRARSSSLTPVASDDAFLRVATGRALELAGYRDV